MLPISQTYGIRLTRREKEIRFLISEGLSSKQVAERLFISEYTVANHRKNILKKKGVRSIKEIVA